MSDKEKIWSGSQRQEEEEDDLNDADNEIVEPIPPIATSVDIDTASISFQQRGNSIINDDTPFARADSLNSDVFTWPQRGNFDQDSITASGPGPLDTLSLSDHFGGLDEEAILQAVVFIEDAYTYRSINHKVTIDTLRIYRKYHFRVIILFRYFIIFLLHMLAFVEYPSSLTLTSDLRTRGERITLPCWLTQITEFICLMMLLLDNIFRMHLMGCHYFVRHKWDTGAVVIILISLVDWAVSFGMGCNEFIRFRRILRPYFIIQNSSLMKKIVNCLRMTLPEVISVLLLLGMHMYIFTLFAMLLFPVYKAKANNVTIDAFGNTTPTPNPTSLPEGNTYFHSLLDSFMSLLVLMTTANNPDVTMPAYSYNRLASVFFILYLLIGLYCFMNILLAVIYNQFRGYFLSSMQSSLLRRRLGVRAAFEVLRRKKVTVHSGVYSREESVSLGVGGSVIQAVVNPSLLPKHVKQALEGNLKGKEDTVFSATQFQNIFSCMDSDVVHKQTPGVRWFSHPKLRSIQRVFIHKYFTYFGMAMALLNLIIISVQLGSKYDASFSENHSTLRIVNFTFAFYYAIEQLIKLWASGWYRYWSNKGNIYDCIVTSALIIGEIVSVSLYGVPYFPKSKEIKVSSSSSTMWNILRIVNMLIMARILKIIPHIKSMSLVSTVLVDLMRNMKSFAGVLVVIFYAFAMLGMELFHGSIKYKPEFVNMTFPCGTYEQLDYWANNFDDFFSSIVVLWDIMVVNNWHVFLEVYRKNTTAWSYLYFVAWWILSVIIVLNLFTALIMENFIMKWDRRHQITEATASMSGAYEGLTVSVHLNNVHSMFRDLLQEPADNELLVLLSDHHFLRLDRG